MAALVLLNLDRREFESLHKRANGGDEAAAQELESLWDDYRDRALACFTCDSVVEWLVFNMVLPEQGDYGKLIAAPLCNTCRALPRMKRLNRAIKVLKKMYSAKSGKNITFHF